MSKAVMPFGKYKGEYVENINDKEYLYWVSENCTLNDDLFKAVESQLENLM